MEDITLLQPSSASTNNNVATGLIKRNGVNYGAVPARAIMYCNALTWPRQLFQTSRDREEWPRDREEECDWEGPGFPAISSQTLGVDAVVRRENTQSDLQRVSLWAAQRQAPLGIKEHQQHLDKECCLD